MTWWYCTDKDKGEKYVWIKTDRWFDARRLAWQILGSESLWITSPKTEKTSPPKQAYKDKLVYKGTWFGTSGHPIDGLRFELKRVLARKLVCECCNALLWPWEVEDLGSHLGHRVVYARGPEDPPGNGFCGPVISRDQPAVGKSPHALPDAEPYEDEIPLSVSP